MEEHKINLNGTIYIPEDKIKEYLESQKENTDIEIKLYQTIKYCGYEWYVIAIEEDGVVLSIRKCLPKEDMQEIFDNDLLDDDGDIQFSYKYDEVWWKNSPIRFGLNSKFLRRKLNREDLVLMESTLSIDDKTDTTLDYVRLLSKEELEKMPLEARIKRDRYFYWAFSPGHFYSNGHATVFTVHTNGYLSTSRVTNAGGVAPVIKLKTKVFENLKKNL